MTQFGLPLKKVCTVCFFVFF